MGPINRSEEVCKQPNLGDYNFGLLRSAPLILVAPCWPNSKINVCYNIQIMDTLWPPFRLYIRTELFTITVLANKNYVTGKLPADKNYVTGKLPANKNYVTGTVPSNKSYVKGTVKKG